MIPDNSCALFMPVRQGGIGGNRFFCHEFQRPARQDDFWIQQNFISLNN